MFYSSVPLSNPLMSSNTLTFFRRNCSFFIWILSIGYSIFIIFKQYSDHNVRYQFITAKWSYLFNVKQNCMPILTAGPLLKLYLPKYVFGSKKYLHEYLWKKVKILTIMLVMVFHRIYYTTGYWVLISKSIKFNSWNINK